MAYVILDPCSRYPSLMMPFPAKLGQPAVAVFSNPGWLGVWRSRWARELGRFVADEYVIEGPASLPSVAQQIRRRWPDLVGIVPWDEGNIQVGAELGDLLGLGWNSSSIIERCRDKAVMKAWLRERASVRINASHLVRSARDALAFQASLGTWPVVVKPTEGSGSEDVYFPDDERELLHRCRQVLAGGSGEVLLEEYIGGTEYCVNGIVDRAGDLLVTDVWQYDRRAAYGEPNVYHQAGKVDTHNPLFDTLSIYAAEVVEALELRRAPIHMEVKVDNRGPCLIEVGARFGGGDLAILASQLHGRSLFELGMCHYLTEMPALKKDLDFERYDSYQARLVMGVQPGTLPTISAVHGVAEVEQLPSFQAFGKLREVGSSAPKTRELVSRAWEVHLFHRDPAQIALDADAARRLLYYS